MGVVHQAVELANAARRERNDYDQVWCVFDRDLVPPDQFNEALELAERQGIRVAYSNKAFELWFLLHFQYQNTGISSKECSQKLGKLMPGGYSKNDPDIYTKLESRQRDAIGSAERLLAEYEPPNPVCDNPSTTVHLLVRELNRSILR